MDTCSYLLMGHLNVPFSVLGLCMQILIVNVLVTYMWNAIRTITRVNKALMRRKLCSWCHRKAVIDF